jgi:phosphoribosylformimino-5-aminoimidazole carboxamide ribonucleotide (ProFAR) isomerase
VAFDVVPALDVAGGRLVTMGESGLAPVGAFDGDPLAAARAYADAGARRLHVVDVDLATTGAAAGTDAIGAIAALGVPVQASGGVRVAADVEALLAAGADRVVLASAALGARGDVASLVASFGERLVLGIEADGPAIRPRGGGPELPLWETLGWLGELAVARYLYTERSRVASLRGPELDGVWALARHTGRPVLAAGGVRSIEDVLAVAALDGSVEGVVVGRALHEGLDLAAAIRAVA